MQRGRSTATSPRIVGRNKILATGRNFRGRRKVIERFHRIGRRARTAGVQEFEADKLNVPGYACYTSAITSHCANRARDMRAMTVVIEGVVIVISKIPTNQIVDIAVASFVNTVSPTRVTEQVSGIDVTICVFISYER